MRRLAQRWLLPFFDPRALLRLAALPRFFAEMCAFKRDAAGAATVRFGDTYPCLSDRTSSTPFDPHYFYQGAWLARRVAANTPTGHIDVGSSVLMISVLSAQVPTTFVDIRPPSNQSLVRLRRCRSIPRARCRFPASMSSSTLVLAVMAIRLMRMGLVKVWRNYNASWHRVGGSIFRRRLGVRGSALMRTACSIPKPSSRACRNLSSMHFRSSTMPDA
jgi:hypothetical protein